MIVLLLLAALARSAPHNHCVFWRDDAFVVKKVRHANASCIVLLDVDREQLNKTGWMMLNATTSGDFSNDMQMQALGFAEGYLFQKHIYNHRANLIDWFLFSYIKADEIPKEVVAYLAENYWFTRNTAQELGKGDAFWRQVQYVMTHFEGLVDGYQAAAKRKPDEQLSLIELWMYLSSGDLLDIVNFAVPAMRRDFAHMTPAEIDEYDMLNSHCSGLLRASEDTLYLSQDAWFFLGSMNRVMKTYTLNLADADTHAQTVTFSSYPGFSFSFDDWLVTDKGLYIIETTNNIYNTDLYNRCSSSSLLSWVRSQVATRMARTPRQWTELFARYNSGTYNNQWLVADASVFQRDGRTAPKDLVWILEQIPGLCAADDVTRVFQQNGFYWPSYNIPYFEAVYKECGYPGVDKATKSHSYSMNPRARIFARDAPAVESLADMKRLMRSNRWQTDDLSITIGTTEPDPGNAISSRYDLRVKTSTPERAKAFGGFDSKIVAFSRAANTTNITAVSSPTHDDQEPWSFNGSTLYCPHRGLPEGPFVYDWVELPLPKHF